MEATANKKKRVLKAMDKVELHRAMVEFKKTTKRMQKAFDSVKKVCKYRKEEESIGFEGCNWFKCENTKHPYYKKSIYPSCIVVHCAYAKD